MVNICYFYQADNFYSWGMALRVLFKMEDGCLVALVKALSTVGLSWL